MFRAMISPIFRSIDYFYSLWYNAPTMLPAGKLEAEFLRFQVTGRHYTTSCNTQSSAHEDGLNYRPKHVELTGIINKPLLLHLVGFPYYMCQWCTVKQISNRNSHTFNTKDNKCDIKIRRNSSLKRNAVNNNSLP